MGLMIRSVSGEEGKVELAGVRAVIGIFLRWTLTRRGEKDSANPSWTLRAVFSYQKDSMLNGPMKKVFKVKFPPKGPWYEVRPQEGVAHRIEDERLVIEGATLCLVESKE